MKDVLRILVTILVSAIFVAGLIFAATYTSGVHIDRQEINREAAPVEGEIIPVKTSLSYHVLCDLGDGYYLVSVRMSGVFNSAPVRLHRNELSKLRRVKR